MARITRSESVQYEVPLDTSEFSEQDSQSKTQQYLSKRGYGWLMPMLEGSKDTVSAKTDILARKFRSCTGKIDARDWLDLNNDLGSIRRHFVKIAEGISDLEKAIKEAQKSGNMEQSIILSLRLKKGEYERLAERLETKLGEYERRMKEIRSRVA